ncbi:MAG: uracil-DNA glycosylase family protein [Candidatus Methylomirabilales bacterium]
MLDQASTLSQKILPCNECAKLPVKAAQTVRPYVKPCAELDIYAKWKPAPIKVVFIAEAPPGNSKGYFYDPRPHPKYKETLRKELFNLLGLSLGDTAAKLAEFKERGYFLVDAIKCRCKKRNGQPPRAVTRTCAGKWLSVELREIGRPERICILGKAALLALSELGGFQELKGYSVTNHCGEVVKVGKHHKVLIWPFLGWRNERYYGAKISMFKKFCIFDEDAVSGTEGSRGR